MAASGIHAEIKKIVTKVTKELIRKHPMFVNAAQWHKQMQDTCRSQQQQIDLMAQRLRKLEHDNFEFTRQIEALTKGKPHQTTNQKPEPEVPAAPPMSAMQIRRLRNKYQFSQDNFTALREILWVKAERGIG